MAGARMVPLLAVLAVLAAAPALVAQDRPAPPEPVPIPGVENAFRLSPRLYSGGQPEGAESFAALKALGIRTILSVDGAAPDVETARAFGLRYVHLPVGYDGIPRDQAVRIIRAIRTLPGPVFIHCHHGKHRGPTAAALCGMATEGWTRDDAARWLALAGTAPDYPGLHASARDFAPPSAEELDRAGADLPERSAVADLVDLMVQVDRRWDQLKAIAKNDFREPADRPDLDPPHEARQLAELFREAGRLADARSRGADFTRRLDDAARDAAALQEAARAAGKTPSPRAREGLEAAFGAVGKTCTACHARHRDNAP